MRGTRGRRPRCVLLISLLTDSSRDYPLRHEPMLSPCTPSRQLSLCRTCPGAVDAETRSSLTVLLARASSVCHQDEACGRADTQGIAPVLSGMDAEAAAQRAARTQISHRYSAAAAVARRVYRAPRRAAPRTHSPHSLRVGAKARLPVGHTDVDGADRGAVRAVEGLRGGEQAYNAAALAQIHTTAVHPLSRLSHLLQLHC